MKQAQKHSIKKGAANTFGYLGYFFCFLQWLWAALLYFSVIQSVTLLVSPNADAPVSQAPRFAFSLPDPVTAAVVGIVVVAMIIVTIYVLIRLPMDIVKNSNKAARKVSQAAVPVVMKVQHKKDTKKNRASLTPKVMVVVKVVLVSIPVILVFSSGLLATLPIEYQLATITGYGLAGLSVLFFSVQYLLAKLFRIIPADLK